MIESQQTSDGTTVRTRTAESDVERAQLRREATMLGLARHPAVVEVLSADADGTRLVTRARGTGTLDDTGPAPGRRLAVLAGAAQAMADLHALGLVHGDLRGSCIWVDDRGHAMLDGFERAGLAGQSVEGGPPLRPSMDVAALAQLAVPDHPVDAGTDGEDDRGHDRAANPSTGVHRSGRPRRRAPGGRRARPPDPSSELAAVLDAGRAGTWPPARRLAALLDEPARRADPDDRQPSCAPAPAPASPDDDPFAHLRPRPDAVRVHRSRRPPAVATVLALVGLVALSWGATQVSGHPDRPTLGAAAPANARARALATSTGPVVAIGGTRYRIGQAGDQVELGSWGCGPTRVVVLRPGTGDVFAFEGWARPGHDLTAAVLARVPPRSRLVSTHRSDGCDDLVAVGPGGSHLDLGPAMTR